MHPLGSDNDCLLFIFLAFQVVRDKRLLYGVLQDYSCVRDGDASEGKCLPLGVFLMSEMPSEILRRGQILLN